MIKHSGRCSDKQKWLVVKEKILWDFFLVLVCFPSPWNRIDYYDQWVNILVASQNAGVLKLRILGNFEISGKSEKCLKLKPIDELVTQN